MGRRRWADLPWRTVAVGDLLAVIGQSEPRRVTMNAGRHPVDVRARLDPPPGRWLWLVKWLLLIPHYVVLAFLWVAFVALTVVAYLSVLFTGRYPRAIHAFNVGVLRWSWRVGYYGYQALGTDRYPPFALAEVPDYPAHLEIEHPERLPWWRPLVSWLLAVPHLIIVAALTGGLSWAVYEGRSVRVNTPGLLAVLVLVAAFALLFTGRYPRGLYDFVIGANRWIIRTAAYVALLAGPYPPFRLDLGGEPRPGGPAPTPSPTAATEPSPAGMAGPPPAAAPLGPGGVAARVVALVAGVLLFLAGGVLMAGGGAALVVNGDRDSDGYVSTQRLHLASDTAAITVEGVEIRPTDAFADYGDVRITASSRDETPLFLGIAAADDVDRWLRGTARDEIRTVLPGWDEPHYSHRGGAVRSIGTPAEQSFWLVDASGTGPLVLNWAPSDLRWSVVLTRADGSVDVNADAAAAIRVPSLTPLGIGLLAGGGVLVLGGVALIYVGAAGLGGRHVPRRPEPSGPEGPSGPHGPSAPRTDAGEPVPSATGPQPAGR
jgi:hypothetical protein